MTNTAALSQVAYHAARSVWLRTRRMADHEDLRAESQLALLQILKKFDSTRTDNLPRHVYSKTRMMLLDYLRAQKPGGRYTTAVVRLAPLDPRTLADAALNPEQQVLAAEPSQRLDALLRRCTLTAGEQAIIAGLRRGECLVAIGLRIGVKESRASQLKISATAKMRAAQQS